jgi:hypothetical protein
VQTTHLRATRRTTLAAGLLTLSGCTLLDDGGSTGAPGGQPDLSDQEYDQRLVDQVAASTHRALATIEVMAAGFDLVAGRLSSLVVMHQAHLSALGVTSAPATTAAAVPTSEAAALAKLRSLEQDLQAQLAAAAGNVRSGALARVLAGMSAGVCQHVAVALAKQARA